MLITENGNRKIEYEEKLKTFLSSKREEANFFIKEYFTEYFRYNSKYKFVLIEHNNPKHNIKLHFFNNSFEDMYHEYIKSLVEHLEKYSYSEPCEIELFNQLNGQKIACLSNKNITRRNSYVVNVFNDKKHFSFLTWHYFLEHKFKEYRKAISPYKRWEPSLDGLDVFKEEQDLISGFTDNGMIFTNSGEVYYGIEFEVKK